MGKTFKQLDQLDAYLVQLRRLHRQAERQGATDPRHEAIRRLFAELIARQEVRRT